MMNELVQNIFDFYYEYENFGIRVYIYRETLTHFIACFFDIKKNTRIYQLQDDTLIKQISVDRVLGRFDRGVLKKLINYRNQLTHKLPADDPFKKRELSKLFKDMESKIIDANKTVDSLIKIQKDVAEKIIQYKNKS